MTTDGYSGLSRTVRAFLETASDQQILDLADAVRWYGDLHDKTKQHLALADEFKQPVILGEEGRRAIYDMLEFHSRLTPPARQFLVTAEEGTFKWLLSLRPEEVEFLQKRTRLSVAFRTAGSFVKYLIVAFAAGLIGVSHFGTEIKNMLSFFFSGGAR